MDDRIEALEAEIAAATGYATRFLENFVSQHFPHNPGWKPLHDLLGVLTQIDNATTVAKGYKQALQDIKDAHIPDQPSHSSADEVTWARQHVAELRRIASKALPGNQP